MFACAVDVARNSQVTTRQSRMLCAYDADLLYTKPVALSPERGFQYSAPYCGEMSRCMLALEEAGGCTSAQAWMDRRSNAPRTNKLKLDFRRAHWSPQPERSKFPGALGDLRTSDELLFPLAPRLCLQSRLLHILGRRRLAHLPNQLVFVMMFI